MTYDNFKDYIRDKCNYETIYSDGEGRIILVITLLDAYTMTHRAPKKWVGLTDEEITEIRLKTFDAVATNYEVYQAIEAKIKAKNCG